MTVDGSHPGIDDVDGPVDPEHRVADVMRADVDGIAVRKEVGRYGDHSKVAFVISSRRFDRARVRLTDLLPSSFPIDHLGFHPDYHRDRWTVEDETRIVFERTLDPYETVVTLYGLRGSDPDLARAFHREPVVAVEAPGAGEGAIRASLDDLEAGILTGFDSVVEELDGLAAEVVALRRAIEERPARGRLRSPAVDGAGESSDRRDGRSGSD